MKTRAARIGNSRGMRFAGMLLAQPGLPDDVEIVAECFQTAKLLLLDSQVSRGFQTAKFLGPGFRTAKFLVMLSDSHAFGQPNFS
jgi:hypothetical protein